MGAASTVEAQTGQTLCSFNDPDGTYPYAALALGEDGNLYGTTAQGGTNGWGTVFKVTTNGALTTLVSFNNTNGAEAWAGLTLGPDGAFYGTTASGGAYTNQWGQGYGTVFRVTTNGTLTTLVSFNGTNGMHPYAGLTLASDGNFYGTTVEGGASHTNDLVHSYGTVFRVTTNGTLITLVSFYITNGAGPYARLTLASDGDFYGTTRSGGAVGYGTVFKVTTNGTLTTLVSFDGNNGLAPYGELALGSDGSFYGTTVWHMGLGGTVFQLTTNGTLTTLVSFYTTNGAGPYAGLTLASDGNFYGTTASGGSNRRGTVFKVTTNGTLTTLVSFNGADGDYPYAGLTLASDGNFYGTTVNGGSNGLGTVFRLLLSPVITVEPQSQTNNAGATVMFFVSATGLSPMSYQWQKNGTNITDGGNVSGADTEALTITSISDSDAASYSVVVSNSIGIVTSANATLTVISPPLITAQPTNLLVLSGTNAAFGVSVSGTAPFAYQWQFNGTNLFDATNVLYSIPSVGANDAGDYAVVITNAAGSVTSSSAALTVVVSPPSQTNYAGSTAALTVTAFSPESLNYQWQKNGTNLVDGGRMSGATTSTLTIAGVSDTDATSYRAVVSDGTGSVTTSNAVLTVNDSLFIASQPQSQTVGVGRNVTFNVIVYGAFPFVYQWYFKGAPFGAPATGTNSSSCTLPNVGMHQAGDYSVFVVNGYGSLMSSTATLTVVDLPTITEQPGSRTNNAGTTATFSVVASSLSPLGYQWRKDGTNLVNVGRISGTSDSTLTITGVSDGDVGVYSVTVTNLAGSATSSDAALAVIDPPIITMYPVGQTVLLGSSVTFSVSVRGTPPFAYQWLLNSTNLPNATNATYAIEEAQASDSGSYSVIVANPAGSATSSDAFLTVTIPPRLELELWAGYPLLSLYGMLRSNFVIQYNSSSGSTNWMDMLSLPNLPYSPYLLLDPAGAAEPSRFYRAIMQ